MTEMQDTQLKRLRMRSWRRGTKEMDLILGPYADGPMATLSQDDLAIYESLLDENDQDLYPWITGRLGGQGPRGPAHLAPLLDRIAAHAADRLSGDR